RLRASAPRTGDSGCGSWPSPIVNDALNSTHCYGPKKADGSRPIFLKLPGAANLASWPTPNTPSGGRSISIEKMDATGRTIDGKKHTASLEHAVKFASWSTPTARDHKDSTSEGTVPVNGL